MSTATAKKFIYEVSLKFKKAQAGQVEIVRNLLTGLGLKQKNIVESVDEPYIYLSLYYRDRLEAKKYQRAIKRFKLRQVAVEYKKLRDKDWKTKWQEEFRPFKLTKVITVVPSWLRKKYTSKTNHVIYINTTSAFGSGLHPTTNIMANFIERFSGRFKTFFDIGTGTGILGLVAAKNEASAIDAIDIGYDAIATAKENFTTNQFRPRMVKRIDFRNLISRRKYDFVAANLITHDLIRFKRKLVSFVKPSGYLAVSGVSFNNLPRCRKAFRIKSLRCLKVEKKEGWAGILFKKVLS